MFNIDSLKHLLVKAIDSNIMRQFFIFLGYISIFLINIASDFNEK